MTDMRSKQPCKSQGCFRHDIINSIPGICRRMSPFSETS